MHGRYTMPHGAYDFERYPIDADEMCIDRINARSFDLNIVADAFVSCELNWRSDIHGETPTHTFV